MKCFKVCGCGKNDTCTYCNSYDFVGYDVKNSASSNLVSAPNSNDLECSSETEYVDVRSNL